MASVIHRSRAWTLDLLLRARRGRGALDWQWSEETLQGPACTLAALGLAVGVAAAQFGQALA